MLQGVKVVIAKALRGFTLATKMTNHASNWRAYILKTCV
jgi:hypothetical protein